MKTWLTIALGLTLLACGTTKQEKTVAKREATAVIGLGALCDDINAGVQRAARKMVLVMKAHDLADEDRKTKGDDQADEARDTKGDDRADEARDTKGDNQADEARDTKSDGQADEDGDTEGDGQADEARDLRQTRREIRRNLILWQLHTVQNCRRALQLPDPRWAFLDLWTMTYQTKLYIERGGSPYARKLTPAEVEKMTAIATEELDKLLEKIRATALRVLPRSQLEQVGQAARLWAEQHPIEGDTILARPSPSEDPSGAFSAILGVPAGVFSFGGGVKETAAAVEDVAIAAHHAVGAVDALPQTVRWQVELLLFALEEDPTLQGLIDDADKASDAVVRVADTVEKLPQRVKETIEKIEAIQPEFRKTLAEGRGVVELAHATVDRASQNVDKLAETFPTVERTTENAKDAGQAWEGAFAQLNLLVHPPKDPNEPPKPPAPPFDIKDAASTAEWATKAAGEVKETVVELRRIIEGEGLDERLAQVEGTTHSTLDRTVARAEDLIDRITARAIIVIVVFFVALLGYRFAAALVPRREE